MGKPLSMKHTLAENGIDDETEEFEKIEVPEDEWYVPCIHIYFNDDLSVMWEIFKITK